MSANRLPLVDHLAHIGGAPVKGLALVAGVLFAPLLGMGVAADRLTAQDVWGLWRAALGPALIVFIVWVYPVLQRRWNAALDSLRVLALQPELVERGLDFDRRREWLSLSLGAAFAAWITPAWLLPEGGLRIYVWVTNIGMFALTAVSISDGLTRSRFLRRIVRAGLKLDLFDRSPLMPLARWGQGVSLTFVGGICLSLLFQSYHSLYTVDSAVIYTILVVVATTLFFMSMWSIHVALGVAQDRELARVRSHWREAREAWRTGIDGASGQEAAALYGPLVVFGAYERQLLESSTWPFNPKILQQLAASLAAPVLIYGLKVAVGLAGAA